MVEKIRTSEQSRRRLLERKNALEADSTLSNFTTRPRSGSDEGSQLNEFLTSLVGRKTRKKQQLKQIKEFFENPHSYGVDIHDPLTSTTRAEIEKREEDLRYRIALLKSLLEAAESELHFFTRAIPCS